MKLINKVLLIIFGENDGYILILPGDLLKLYYT
jgi:hypothetical protein